MLPAHVSLLRNGIKTKFRVSNLQRVLQISKTYSKSSPVENLLCHQATKTFSTTSIHFTSEKFAPKDPDVFGDIAGNKYEEAPLTEDENTQEEFEKNEGRLPRYLKPSSGQYGHMIKNYITKGDLESAVGVLDLIKENRDQPVTYHYTLLLRAFAVQGNLKKTYKLFTDMKKRALKLNSATYVSVINACANCANSKVALEYLEKVREQILDKNVVLNTTHYNALVKAYGRHQQPLEAFKIVDQMVDNKVNIDSSTFNSLIYAAISDKENGLRHTLVVWHMMQRWSKKRDIITYNLLLRAMRDTKLGNLKLNDWLLENSPETQVVISDFKNPDLLNRTPMVSQDVFTLGIKQIEQTENAASKNEETSESEDKKENTELIPVDKNKIVDIKLQEIHKNNKLILFGGFTGFLKRMQDDGVRPDAKTMTLLLDIVPNSLAIEKTLIDTARKEKVPLDIDFFNMLIKKRSFRKDYKAAKNVLDEIHRHNLIPDMITWGVLALGCQTLEEATTLLEGMQLSGHALNPIIAGSLLGNASCTNRIGYLMEIMQLIKYQRIQPTEHIYHILDKYKAKTEHKLKYEKNSRAYKNPEFRSKFEIFKNRYERFQAVFKRDPLHAHVKPR